MRKVYDLVKFTTATTGTGTITVGSAVAGFKTPADANVSDGEAVSYAIKNGSHSETGHGIYSAAGPTLTRNVIESTNANDLINLSGTSTVVFSPIARDLNGPGMAIPTGTVTVLVSGQSNARGNNDGGLALSGVDANVKMWDNAAAIAGAVGTQYVTPTLGSAPLDSSATHNCPVPWLGHLLAETFRVSVNMTLVYQSGTAISEWIGSPRPMYDRIIAVHAAQGGGAYDVFVFQHGESDGLAGRTTAQYKADLQQMLADLMSAGVIDYETVVILATPSKKTEYATPTAAMRELVSENLVSKYVLADCTSILTSDDTHFTGAAISSVGYAKWGEAYYSGIGYFPSNAYANRASVAQTTANSCPNAPTKTTLTWQVENYDIGGWFTTGASSRFTVPIGVSLISSSAVIKLTGAAGTNGYVQLEHYDSNDTLLGTYLDGFNFNLDFAASFTSPPLDVNPGDYFTLNVGQNSGGTLQTNTTTCIWTIAQLV